MSDPVLVTIIGSVQAIALAAIAAWLKRSQDSNHADTKNGIAATRNSVEDVRREVNGKMAELLRVTAEAERAKGTLEGKAEARADADKQGG